jgi:hypothetical protein
MGKWTMTAKNSITFNVCSLLLLATLLTGCNLIPFKETYLTKIPVHISISDSQQVDANNVIKNVTPKIQKILPNAQLSTVVFSGSCEDLPQLQGKIVLGFTETRFSIPNRRVISAIASVNTVQEVMDIHLRDMTDYYWSTETLDIEGDNLSMNEIASKAFQQIRLAGLSDCDVTLTRLKDSWDVRCGPLENFIQECRFEIHSTTGEIIYLEN